MNFAEAHRTVPPRNKCNKMADLTISDLTRKEKDRLAEKHGVSITRLADQYFKKKMEFWYLVLEVLHVGRKCLPM